MSLPLRAHHVAGLAPGPKLIVLGAVHGNEVCGTRAIERVLGEIERDEWRIERGALTLVPATNPLAYARGTRVGERNLNRHLLPCDPARDNEDRIANLLCPWLAAHDVLLDLHSFRSHGQPFVMRGPADNDGALEPFAHAAAEGRLAAHLGPVRIVDGWMSAYAQGAARRRARGDVEDADPSYGVGTTEYMRRCGGYALTLECGQHDDPAAPDVAHHAIHQAVALLGLADLPLRPPAAVFECLCLTEVIDRVHADDRFVREWMSFDAVRAGDLIGVRHDGAPVRAEREGRIVFPDPAAAPGHEWFYFAAPSQRPLP
ncbi:MAG: succinylglutamate desuccinylase/aspartoacylase family protein [Aquincola sp.]|nr:succinylglutamate desuccinylase/aspartoacylase family protein [Aquincola sp.]MDH4287823.1 succinylglutamate desuccinylase/aspartoacylase family protein [Aquincola sp.]MDH5328548.1 succinylglutamate desuccinylase/aspartoacylase family protein [Aquincola sp.]